MYELDKFIENGFCQLGKILDVAECQKLIEGIQGSRDFSSSLFLSEEDYRANPTHKGVNPIDGRNLIEKFNVDFIEKNPVFVSSLEKTLGKGYNVFNKKFVVGVPETWMPEWLLKETENLAVANMGAYIKPEYRDITYFHGIDFHQDIIDHKNRLSDFVTLYVYLEDTDENTSPLYVIPRSHKFGATTFPHDITYKAGKKLEYSDRKGHQDEFENLMLTSPGGTVYFWHACTLHGTKPHIDSKPRISVRYLIEKDPTVHDSLIDKLNDTIIGDLALETTRVDLNEKGEATVRQNIINAEGK